LSTILFGALLICVAIGAAGAVIFSSFSPAELVQAEAIRRVKAATGRDLVIAGPASFRFFPSIGFTLSDVSLSAPAGSNEKPLITVSSMDLSVRLLTLLRQKVVVDRLILKNPVVELHVDEGGRKSWDFAERPQSSKEPVLLAQASSTASDADGILPATDAKLADDGLAADGIDLENLELGNVGVENGTLHFSDARTGAREEATGINIKVSLRSVSRPLETSGSLIWKGEKIDLDATLTSIKMLMENHPARIALTLASPVVKASYDGSFRLHDELDAEGAITSSAQSLRDLAKWLGTDLPQVDGFGPFEMKGLLRLAGRVAALNNANIVLDGATITGQVSVDTAQARPFVRGNLKFSELDLNKYAGPSLASKPPKAAKSKPAPSAEKSIDDLLNEQSPSTPGPKVKGYTQRAGWSEGLIDASALGLIDTEAQIMVGKLFFKDLKVGQSVMKVDLKNKVLRSTFDDIQLYNGHGRGLVTLDATAGTSVAIATNLTLEGISAQPLLKDAANMDWLAGTAKMSLVATGQGQNQRQIVETLAGKTDILVTNGAIVGWNIPGMIRGLSQGKLSGLNRTPSEKTDFSEMSSSWTITNGIAQNEDLRLLSPLLRVTGAGSVMLPSRQVDYTVRPVLVASLEGQGAASKAQGLEIPVRIHGSWDKPSYTPDIGGVLKDPNQAVQTIKEIGKQFKGKSADEIVKDLLGKNSDPNAAPSTGTTTKDQGKQLLDQLFKPQ
jgi:AsmA protein